MSYRTAIRLKLESCCIDEPGVADPFSARLSRENCWSIEFTQRAIREYKRFVQLAVAAAHPVAPSDAVDQVWHLHLTYTKSYWGSFCESVLRGPLHHEPSRGGLLEQATYRNNYQKTLKAYVEAFGNLPPEDIWPPAERRFSASQQFVRVSPATTFVVRKQTLAKAAGLALAAATLGALVPRLELSHPVVLPLFLGLWAGCVGVAVHMLQRKRAPATEDVPELHPYEAAHIAGNEPAVANAVVATLVATGSFSFNAQRSMLSRGRLLPATAHPVEKAAYDSASGAAVHLDTAYEAAANAARDIGTRLSGLGFVLRRSSPVPLWIALLAPYLATVNLAAEMLRGKPVGSLTPLIALITICVVAAVYFGRPRRMPSSLGVAALAAATERLAYLDGPAHWVAGSPDRVRLAVGLRGLEALAELGLEHLREPLDAQRKSAARCGAPLSWISVLGGGCGGGGCGGGCGGE